MLMVTKKKRAPLDSTAQQLSLDHFNLSVTDLKVRITSYGVINSTLDITEQYLSLERSHFSLSLSGLKVRTTSYCKITEQLSSAAQ